MNSIKSSHILIIFLIFTIISSSFPVAIPSATKQTTTIAPSTTRKATGAVPTSMEKKTAATKKPNSATPSVTKKETAATPAAARKTTIAAPAAARKATATTPVAARKATATTPAATKKATPTTPATARKATTAPPVVTPAAKKKATEATPAAGRKATATTPAATKKATATIPSAARKATAATPATTKQVPATAPTKKSTDATPAVMKQAKISNYETNRSNLSIQHSEPQVTSYSISSTSPTLNTTSYVGKSHDERTEFLNAHNGVRQQSGLAPLQWDTKLAAYSAKYAFNRHDDCDLLHSYGQYGENIFWGSGTQWTPTEVVRLWVKEQRYYDRQKNLCMSGQMCGHYTQIVWRNTRHLGCAKIQCMTGDTFAICNYDPPGN